MCDDADIRSVFLSGKVLIGKAEGGPDLVTKFEVGRFTCTMAFEEAKAYIDVNWAPEPPKENETTLHDYRHYEACRDTFYTEVRRHTGFPGLIITWDDNE